MKKNQLPVAVLLFSAACFFLISCQKDADPTPPPGSEVSSDNPAQLSAALKVWHGKRTTGNPPASTGNTPVLDPTVNTEIRAFAGRYAIIKPEVLSGEIAGYYVSVPGAGQYFKVDFSNPRNMAGRPNNFNNRRLGTILSRPQNGNADSSIVIVLPPNIQVPDTFCVTYCAFDPQGNIGQPVTTCIIVSSLGGDAGSAWLQNEWRLTASWELVNGQREWLDTIIYNKWAPTGGYECYRDSATGLEFLDWIGMDPGAIVADSMYTRKANLRFATNGAMDYKDDMDEKYVDVSTSTCSLINFHPIETWSDSITGGWSYNSASSSIMLIFEFDALGVPEPEIWEYGLIKVNDNHWIMRDPWGDYFYRWQRF
jgi:hypothetical protein